MSITERRKGSRMCNTYDDVKDPLRDNYYALLIAIIANKTVSQSLQLMGLSGEMSMAMKKSRIQTQN